jgi:hypothetical protein
MKGDSARGGGPRLRLVHFQKTQSINKISVYMDKPVNMEKSKERRR